LVLAQAIAPSTRRTYAAPLRSYADFCTARGHSGDASFISTTLAGDWLATLAVAGRHTASTLKLYRSALSTAWEESGAMGPNPLQSALIERHLRGADRLLHAQDAAARERRAQTFELTPRVLGSLQHIADRAICAAMEIDDPLPLLCWAAACFGVFGLLRPSEFLAQGYQRFSSNLHGSSVRFYVTPETDATMDLLPRGVSIAALPIPDRFDISLGASKADQSARNAPCIIAAPICVRAVWQWAHARRDRGHHPHEPLFVRPDGQALSRPQLLQQLTIWLTPLLGAAPKLTGKAFRRGGASGMLAGGASVPAIMQAGRWKSAAMVGVYSSAESQRVRAAMESRALDPSRGMAAAATTR